MHFSSGKKQIRENTCVKQHAFLVAPLGDLLVFRIFKIPCFSKKLHNLRKKVTWEAHSALWATQIAKGPIPIQKVGPKESIASFGGGQRIRASRPPCLASGWESQLPGTDHHFQNANADGRSAHIYTPPASGHKNPPTREDRQAPTLRRHGDTDHPARSGNVDRD